MAVWSVTNAAAVTQISRIDSDYFSPTYIRVEELLSRVETRSLAQLFHISDGNHLSVSRHFVDGAGVPYFRGQDITGFFLEDAAPVRIPQELFASPLMRRSHFLPGDVLLSIVGTIGSLAIVPTGLGPATGSCKIAILRQKMDVSGAFLAAFLLSRFGQAQIRRHTRGAVQMGLILKDLCRIFIPIVPAERRNDIALIVENALTENQTARHSYSDAEDLLIQSLGLCDLPFQRWLGYSASLSHLQGSRRFDPEHYYPTFQAFKDSLPEGITLSPLSHHLTFCQRGKQPVYAPNGLPVINSKHVQPNRVMLEGNRRAGPNPDARLQIRFGDTLLNGTGRGTLGRAAPCLFDEPAIPDNHVTILRSADLDPVYLSLYLNSAAGQMQVEMHQRGSSGQLELYPFDIRKFLIWPAPKSLQRELRDLHEKAAAAEQESKRLLEQAKTRVEQLIEEAAGE